MYKLKRNIVKINERKKGPTEPWKILAMAVKSLFTLFSAYCDGQDTPAIWHRIKIMQMLAGVYMV